MPNEWENAATLAAVVGAAYVLVLWLSIVAWTYRDIRDRSRDAAFQVVAVLLVLVFNILGWFIYMILRPRETLSEAYARSLEEEALLQELDQQGICPSCRRYVSADFLICPYCRRRLKEACANCGRPLNLNWLACPYCTMEKAVVTAAAQGEVGEVGQAEKGMEIADRGRATSPQTSLEP